MKKIIFVFVALGFSLHFLHAQCPRKTLVELFTSETCMPDFYANPGLKIKVDSNQARMAMIAWHVPLPNAPSTNWSPYQANQVENYWRWAGPAYGGYGYAMAYTPTGQPLQCAGYSPTVLLDGQSQWNFGAQSNHSSNFQTTYLNKALAVSSPFCILMNSSWDETKKKITVTVTITATEDLAPKWPLYFRLVMTEELHFSTPPGTNGEKDFYHVPRKSYPSKEGTQLPASLWNGQVLNYVLSCPIPSNVINTALIKLAGFIQEDGSKKVMQAEVSVPQALNTNTNTNTTAIEKRDNSSPVELYPNPAQSFVNIKMDSYSSEAVIEIANGLGQIVHEQTATAGVGDLRLDTRGWPAGLYQVKISAGNSSVVKKLLISE
jgi:hypothetical protein